MSLRISIHMEQRRQWHPTPVLLPGKSHGWRSLVGCSPWGCQESDTTERLHFDFSLSCIGERNGNPLQCSCLENSRDGGVWWAAVSGVTQSRTRLKWLSSIHMGWASLVAQMAQNPPAMQETWVCSLSWEDPLEEGMATIPVLFPGELHGQRSLAGCKESDTTEQLSTAQHRHMWWRRKWQPTPLFLPGKFHGQRSLVAIVHEVAANRTGLSNWAFTYICETVTTIKAINISITSGLPWLSSG